MYLLKSVPAQSHCSKHVEVFFDNLSTVYEEYSSPKSVWQKHFKYHIRLFLPALYILKVIFLLLNQTLHITAHKMSLICHASLTDSVYRSIHGYNDLQLLLPKTRYNKLHTTEPACTSTLLWSTSIRWNYIEKREYLKTMHYLSAVH